MSCNGKSPVPTRSTVRGSSSLSCLAQATRVEADQRNMPDVQRGDEEDSPPSAKKETFSQRVRERERERESERESDKVRKSKKSSNE